MKQEEFRVMPTAKNQTKAKIILISVLWAIVMLVFPVASGVTVTVRGMTQIQIFLNQGFFMLASIVVPIIYLRAKKIDGADIGVAKLKPRSAKDSLYFLPLILAEIPLVMFGADFVSVDFALALGFFAVAVGFAEEIYFRGVILRLLRNTFPVKRAVLVSAVIFGAGHFAGVLASGDVAAAALQVLNAVVFGVIAAELVSLAKSLLPVVLWHAVFNYVNHVALASGTSYVVAIAVHEAVMIAYMVYLWRKL